MSEVAFGYHGPRYQAWEKLCLPWFSERYQEKLARWVGNQRLPRVAIVKQDCNEDLYCVAPGCSALETIQSTLLRPGPVGLFTLFDPTFYLVRTEPDPECNIWKEKWEPLRWCPVAWFESFRDKIPGRDYGQSKFARSVEAIPWQEYDLVISIDVSVPARITRQHPATVWAYYVREIKTPSYRASLDVLLPGQDLYLDQVFAPRFHRVRSHVVNFPYHFHYFGVFHQLTGRPIPNGREERCGVFVEHHSGRAAPEHLKRLAEFGPVYGTGLEQERQEDGKIIPHRTMETDVLNALMRCKYHVKWDGRSVFGTAKVEAIAAGCLALADPAKSGHTFFYAKPVRGHNLDELIAAMRKLETDPDLYHCQLLRQRRLLDYLCFYRPAVDLLEAWERVRHSKLSR